jgi:hypothetical protein
MTFADPAVAEFHLEQITTIGSLPIGCHLKLTMRLTNSSREQRSNGFLLSISQIGNCGFFFLMLSNGLKYPSGLIGHIRWPINTDHMPIWI